MLFGATTFANSPFADPGGISVQVLVNGQQLNFAIGNVVIEGKSNLGPNRSRRIGELWHQVHQTI